MISHGLSSVLIAGAMLAGAGTAPTVVTGILTCTVEGGLPADGARDMRCVFKTAQMLEETYTGSIRTTGRDTAADKAKLVAMWEVLTPDRHLKRGSLAGRFVDSREPGRLLFVKYPDETLALKPVGGAFSSEPGGLLPAPSTTIELRLEGTTA